MEYDNNNRGSIWKNDKKDKDTHPDFTGSLNVDGKEFWVSAWKRKPGANEKAPALSFSVKSKDEAAQGAKQAISNAGRDPISTGRPRRDELDDEEIPFAPEFR